MIMRDYIDVNIKVIKKHINSRKKVVSRLNKASILNEFKEWSGDPIPKKELIWTLPDLTRIERFKNFCRSIKKEIK